MNDTKDRMFDVNISFHVLDISRFEKKLVWVKCVCGGGGGEVFADGILPYRDRCYIWRRNLHPTWDISLRNVDVK